MSNLDVLRNVQAGAGREALDGIEIFHENGSLIVTRLGLRVSLKFQNGHTIEKRKAGLQVMLSFWSTFEDRLTHWLPGSGGSPRKITPGQAPPIDQPAALANVKAWYGCRLYGYPKEQETGEPALLMAHLACAWNKETKKNSTFAAHLPLSWCVEHGFDRVRELVRQ